MAPLKTGILTKRGSFFKSWNHRWFKLSESGTLEYFDEGQKSKKGSVDCAGCTVVHPKNKELTKCKFPAGSLPETRFGIITKARALYLYSDKATTTKEWIEAFEKCAAMNAKTPMSPKMKRKADAAAAAEGGAAAAAAPEAAAAEKSAPMPADHGEFADELATIAELKKSHPGNRMAKHFDVEYFNTLDDEGKKGLMLCCKSGIENADSGMGVYAMQPADYDRFKPFFSKVLADYHSVAEDAKHVNDWSLEGVEGLPEDGKLDLAKLGLPALSMRVRVGRNLADFPLPGAMTKDHRIAMEKKMCEAFEKLKSMPEYGGKYNSLTPDHPDKITDAEYEQLVKDHIMFKDMAADTYLASAGIASDWPYGRGCYVSEDRGFVIWVGEEDHLRIMCLKKGTLLNEVFDPLKKALGVVESIEGLTFATSADYGCVTSCPTNLGTGMRASVHIQLPNLTKGGSDAKAKVVCKPLGLGVRGMGGEHTAIGEDGTCDISPRARFCIKEAEIITALYTGIKNLKEKEDDPAAVETPAAASAEPVADIALIGLAVMGQNLILNMNDHGFVVCAYNRTTAKVDKFLENEAKGTKVVGAHSIEEMCSKLKKPRRVMMLVKAGKAVDAFIEQLVPHMEKGDIIIDGGNSEYLDTNRRVKELAEKGILFMGSGVSGGEEGARYGPSIMPGGAADAWPHVKDILQGVSAKVDDEPCCDWVGEDGAGHYVKMVHNGIEYGDMQLCCEAYSLMTAMGMTCKEQSEVFKEWNKGELDSFLVEITADILAYNDEDGTPLVEKIKDTAGQKGTGKWTAINSLDVGIPVTLIAEAVFGRCLSSIKDERVAASKALTGPTPKFEGDRAEMVEHIRKALYASKIVSYAQGFMLLRAAAKEYGWKLNYPSIALMWRGGCIIRSRFLGEIKSAFTKSPDLSNLLVDDFFKDAVHSCQDSWRKVVAFSVRNGIPVPTFSTSLAFFDGYRSERLPANLIQAQRDYFGAHTYELSAEPGKFVHTNWTGRGGNVSSSTYNA